MTRRKTTLIKSTVLPMVAAAGVAVGSGMATTASAEAGCSYGTQSAQLPAAKAHDGNIILAMSHGKKPCGASACSPCAAKPCSPCAAKPCSPCAANPCNPCAAKKK